MKRVHYSDSVSDNGTTKKRIRRTDLQLIAGCETADGVTLGNVIPEADVKFLGELREDLDDNDDSESEEGVPIRTLDEFILFSARTHKQISLMSVLTDALCDDWVGYGNIVPVPIDVEDEAVDDDDEEERQGVTLSSILECSVHWVDGDDDVGYKLDERIWIRTRYAWYILLRPAPSYEECYRDVWVNHLLTHTILVSAMEDDRVAKMDILNALSDAIDWADHPPDYFTHIKKLSVEDLATSDFVAYFTSVMDKLCEEEPEFCGRFLHCALVTSLHPHLADELSTPSRVRRHHDRTRSRKSRASEKEVLRDLNPTVVTPRVAAIATKVFSQPLEVADMGDDDDSISTPGSHAEHLNNPNHIEWLETADTSGIYRSVNIDGIVYSAGDVVIVEPGLDANVTRAANARSDMARCANTLADTKWFCKICYLFEDIDGIKSFHAQWLEHGSKTLLQRTAHSRGLFWLNECTDLSLECIHSLCNVRFLRVDELEPPDDGKDANDFFVSLTWDADNQAFVELSSDQQAQALARCEPSKPCISCGLEYMAEESDETLLTSRGALHRGVDYHRNDFIYVLPQRGRVFDIAQITKFELGKGSSSVCAQVRVYGRYDRYLSKQNNNAPSMKDNRRLYMTDHFRSVDFLSVVGKAFVSCPHTTWDKEAWAKLDDHFYCDLYQDPDIDDLRPLEPSDLPQCEDCHALCMTAFKEEEALVTRFQRLRGLELFAGAGGLATGIDLSGFVETKWAVEFSPSAARTYKANHKNSTVYNQCSNLLLQHAIDRVEGRHPSPLKSIDNMNVLPPLPLRGEVDFIYGGPPCQSFSRMNHKRRPDDKRSTLVCNMISYVEFFKPKYFLLENVPGLLDKKPAVVNFIFRALIALGYQVHFKVLQAVQYGSPQERRRVIFLAAQRGISLPEFPFPQYAPESDRLRMHRVSLCNNEIVYPLFRRGDREEKQCAPLPAVTVEEAIGDLPGFDWMEDEHQQKATTRDSGQQTYPEFKASSRFAGYIQAVPYSCPPFSRYQYWMREKNDGTVLYHHNRAYSALTVKRVVTVPMRAHANHMDLPKHLHLPRLRNREDKSKGSAVKSIFGRLDGEGHFGTVMTTLSPVHKGGKVLHPRQKRVITIREFARAQGFPDNYVFLSTRMDDAKTRVADQVRQIGNAVPIPLGLALGKQIGRALLGVWKTEKERQENARGLSPAVE